MFQVSWKLLAVLLLGTATAGLGTVATGLAAGTMSRSIGLTRTLAASGLMALSYDVATRARRVNPQRPDDVFAYYMRVWNVFYACYCLLPLAK